MIKKENKKCCTCNYLDGFANENIKKYLNSLIYQEIKYKDFIDECRNINLKNQINNNIRLPTLHFIKKHYNNCLVDFKPNIKETNNNKSNKTNIDVDDSILKKPDIIYTDYSDYKPEEIPIILKSKMLDVACKLADIASYKLDEYKSTSVKSNENLKDALISFKLIIELFNIETNKSSNFEREDKDIEELMKEKACIDSHLNNLNNEKR